MLRKRRGNAESGIHATLLFFFYPCYTPAQSVAIFRPRIAIFKDSGLEEAAGELEGGRGVGEVRLGITKIRNYVLVM